MKKLISIPNLITFSRLPLALLTVFYLDSWLKFLFLGLAILSDLLDGFTARKLNQVTKFGATFDGFMDKMFFIIVLVSCFLIMKLPLQYLFLVLARDLFIIFSFLVAFVFGSAKKLETKAKLSGKILTLFQFIFVVFLLAGESEKALTFVWIVFGLSLVSIADYSFRFYRGVTNKPS